MPLGPLHKFFPIPDPRPDFLNVGFDVLKHDEVVEFLCFVQEGGDVDQEVGGGLGTGVGGVVGDGGEAGLGVGELWVVFKARS